VSTLSTVIHCIISVSVTSSTIHDVTGIHSHHRTRYKSDKVCTNFYNYRFRINRVSFTKFILYGHILLCQHSPLTLWVRISLRRDVLNTTLWNKVCQWLAVGRWFPPGTPVSSTNKTDGHDIIETLLKVALSTINQRNKTTTMFTTTYVKCSLYSRWSNEVLFIVLRLLFCANFSSMVVV
jgi:hypothetical protein